MSITTKVIDVNGEKIESMVLDKDQIRLISKKFNSIEDFNESWNKKISLANKVKIDYQDIKSITKEDAADGITIRYSGGLGSKSCKIEFPYDEDRDAFYEFLTSEKHFARTEEKLSAFDASKSMLISLAVTIALFVFAYFQALEITSPGFIEDDGDSRSSRKARSLHAILEFLGPNGVLLIGLALIGFMGYKLWNRYKNPPLQIKFTPKQ